jgi:ribosomal subunit interface protein
MPAAIEIRFLGIAPSPAVEAAVQRKSARLGRFSQALMSCRVSIDAAHKHQHQGHPYRIRIDVTLPGHELVVDRVEHEDVYVALRHAFDSMRRQLAQTMQRRRGQIKKHSEPLHGAVIQIDAESRYGLIETPDGTHYWFSPENLAGMPFEHITLGTPVQFLPELAAQGLQAKRISVGKHHFN